MRKGRGGKIFAILLSIVIFFALIIFGVVMIGRQVISSQTDNIAAKFLPSSGSSGSSEGSASVTDAVSQMGSATPSAIATKLNENADVIKIHSQLSPKFFVVPCNTAHYYFDEMQKATEIPILHMPRIAVDSISHHFPKAKRVAVLATEGTILTGV